MENEKLPIVGTVKLALRWGFFVVRRHWLIILIFAALLVACLLYTSDAADE